MDYIISDYTVQNWFKPCKSGDLSHEINPRSMWQLVDDYDALKDKNLVTITVKFLEDLGTSKDTTCRA